MTGWFGWIQYVLSKAIKKGRLASNKQSSIHKTSKVESGSSVVNSSMARHSFCGYDCDIVCADIGAFTSIANGVILGGGRHPMEWAAMSPVFYEGRDSVTAKYSEHLRPPPERVVVGNDVWIGRNAIVLPGVTIGDGAVIGAGSVVSRSVEPYSIVAGVPAREIRKRFDTKTINCLLASQWWDLPDAALHDMAPYVTNPLEFLHHAPIPQN